MRLFATLWVSTVPQCGAVQPTLDWSTHSWTPRCISFLALSTQPCSRGFQSLPTSNHQLYEGKLLQTDCWRKLVLMRVGRYIMTSWHLQPNTISPAIPKAFVAWVGTSWHQQSMERILEVGLSGHCTLRGWPHNQTTGLCSSSTTMVSTEPFPHRTRSLRCL